jgi:hypothetical protein
MIVDETFEVGLYIPRVSHSDSSDSYTANSRATLFDGSAAINRLDNLITGSPRKYRI